MYRSFASLRMSLLLTLAGIVGLSGCMVGPKYKRPAAPPSAAFREPPPEGWKQAQPNESVLRGKWWELYNDPALNALEEQVTVNNNNILLAMAQYREARDQLLIARSSLFPTITTIPTVTGSRASASGTAVGTTGGGVATTGGGGFSSKAHVNYNLPFDFSYQADIWGNIRRNVRSAADLAQVSAADLENVRLTMHAELAQDYFQLHGLDGDMDLLERTVTAYEENLKLTQARFKAGVASGADVAQAQTQLSTTQAQLVDLSVARAQFEHAIASLIGKAPSELTIPRLVLKTPPPAVPVGMPSALLERRPDIAAAERQAASANEQIGIAMAAYYPQLTISASAGFQASKIAQLISLPSRFWSLGPSFSEILFDAGRRHAQVDFQRAAFDATSANYRQTVLTAFQQVEDDLAALRILENEAAIEAEAVKAAEESLTISIAQYKAGTNSYLQVITSQTIALQNERTAVDILTRRMVSSVLLIEALGGGWDTSQLPQGKDLMVSGK